MTLASILLVIMWTTPNGLEGQGQIPSYTIPSEIYLRCTYWPSLVTLASILQKLSRGQARFFADFDLFYPNDLEGLSNSVIYNPI